MIEILAIGDARRADEEASRMGVPGFALMRAAGSALAREALMRAAGGPVSVLCGPGNNGGDGYVAAAGLRAAGRDVTLYALGDPKALTAAAAQAAALWNGPAEPLENFKPAESGLVLDAMFGAGLSRPLEGAAAAAAEACNASRAPVLAADTPSGLNGDTGAPMGALCVRADATVTFFRKKPGHLLYPGRALCGEVIVADIGIPPAVLDIIAPRIWENAPALWMDRFPRPDAEIHKHSRGRLAVVCGGALSTGAARLAVAGGRRAGAGFTTLFGTEDALRAAAAHETGAVLHAIGRGAAMAGAIAEFGAHAAVAGPAAGADVATRELVLELLDGQAALVLDADALTAFEAEPETLFGRLRADCVLTPHEGEFTRLFKELPDKLSSKLERAKAAARASGAVVLLKGPDTVIAAPDGRAAINAEGAPWLASAGTGDVLAGIIGGLLAQRMPAFEAACAGVWLHGRAGRTIGPGLIAEDIPDALPAILRALLAEG